MSSGQLFQCPECDQEFTLNKNLIRHVNTVHGTVKRQDNEARKQGLFRGPPKRGYEFPDGVQVTKGICSNGYEGSP